jgi:outer membrane protein assembly factor BamB
MLNSFKSIKITVNLFVIAFITIVVILSTFPALKFIKLNSKLSAITIPNSILDVQNAATINTVWTGSIGASASTSSPVVALGNVYIGSMDGTVYAFDASVAQNCTFGSPTTCGYKFAVTPIPGDPVLTSPVIYNSTLFVTVGDQLFAYDANGLTNCSGTPDICTPLWETKSNGGTNISTPVVSNGRVYFHDSLGLYAYDASGVANCSGTPTTCSPLWQGSFGSMSIEPPVAYNNSILTESHGNILAYDASGITGCSGTVVICNPLWSASTISSQFGLFVSGSNVYAVGSDIYGFDAAGIKNCSGTPVVCQPIWTGEVTLSGGQLYSGVTVSNNILYVEGPGELLAFDTTGSNNCTGSTPVCLPLWSGTTGTDTYINSTNSAPVVANGIVFIGNSDQKLYLFDATGSTNCSVSTLNLNICKPLSVRTTGGSIESTPVVLNGNVYVGSDDGNLYAFGNAAEFVDATGGPIDNITTSPQTLDPAYSADATNYILVCQPGLNMFSVTLSSSTSPLMINGTSGNSLTISFGLYPNQALVINGSTSNNMMVQDWVRCLPPDFPVPTVSKPGANPPGYYLYGTFNSANLASDVGNYAVVADQNGIPVWYQKVNSPLSPLDFQLLPNDVLSWSGISLSNFSNLGYEMLQLDSNAHTNLFAPEGVTGGHELIERPDGNYYIIGNILSYGNLSSLGLGSDAPFINYLIEEFSPNGQLLWEWNLADHIGPDQCEPKFLSTINDNGLKVNVIYHANSLDVSSDGTQILLSIRDTSAVYDISKATGQVLWKLGGNGISSSPQISVVNDPNGTFSGQHDARFEPNNDISIFDDETFTSNTARAVEYHLDFSTMTASPVFQFLNPTGSNTFATGSFRIYDNGNDNLIDWGMTANSGYTEVNASGSVLMRVVFPSGYASYRTIKVPTSSISLQLLRDTAGLPPSAQVSSLSTNNVSEVNGNYYNSVAPTRILDTRSGLGQGGVIAPLGGNQTLTLNLNGVNSIPSNASAVVLNVTATNTTKWSFLTIYPKGAIQPDTSNLNWYYPGQTVANTVIVPINSLRAINFYNSFGSVDVIADLEGFIGPALPGSGLFNPVSQTRICDTRLNSGFAYAGQTLQQGSTLDVQAAGVGGIPTTGVSAVMVNITATNTTSNGGYITVYPTGSEQPGTSDLNWSQGSTVANMAIVPVGAGGQISIYNFLGTTDIIVDVLGYFTDDSNFLATGEVFNSVIPTVRLADTRSLTIYPATAIPLSAGSTLSIPVPNYDNVSGTSMIGAVLNVTATNTTGNGFLTVYPAGVSSPDTSTLNYTSAGETVSNLTTVELGTSNSIIVKNNGATSVDVVVDLEGWY